MTGQAFRDTLAGFRRWAGTRRATLHGELEEDADELDMLFRLLSDQLGIDTPAELTAGSLRQLLLSVYPRKITVLDPDDIALTIPAVRDLVSYLSDTGAVTAAAARAMSRELDSIEPRFAEAVTNPANWGTATSVMHAMHRDGVNIGDQAAIDAWIAQHNAKTAGAGKYLGALSDGDDDDDLDEDDEFEEFELDDIDDIDDIDAFTEMTWDGIDLKDAFGLPDIVRPVRRPELKELAAQAREAPLMVDLRRLADDVRTGAAAADSVDPLLLDLAEQCELVENAGDRLFPGDDAGWLDDLDDDAAALDAWEYAFGEVLDTTLDAADEQGPEVGGDLDLEGHGIGLIMNLFLAGGAGVPVTELSATLKSASVAELGPGEAESQWEEWTGAHGDPAGLLVRQLTRLCAVTVTDGAVRLEPLALTVVADRLEDCDVHVPDLPPPAEMTASDLVELHTFGAEEDFQPDFAAWVRQRTPETAARELLAYAAEEPAALRIAAMGVVAHLEEGAEPALRDALSRPELRVYAKMELARLHGDDQQEPADPQLRPTAEDLAWLVADSFAPIVGNLDRDEKLRFDPSRFTTPGLDITAETLFDAIARLDHPDAPAVLSLLGQHCEDKNTAKAARKAAFVAGSRRAARKS